MDENRVNNLRRYLIDAGRASGAALSDSVSDDFLSFIPDEISAVISGLRMELEIKELEKQNLRQCIENLKSQLVILES